MHLQPVWQVVSSDENLVLLAQNGHTDAFESLVGRYIFTVNRRVSCYKGTGIEPEDLAQEGMIGLLRAVRSYRPDTGASFRTFAWLCINRSLLSAVRAGNRKKQIPPGVLVYPQKDGSEERLPCERVFEPEYTIIEREDLDFFWRHVRQSLSPFEREVLLTYLDVGNYQRIAQQLGTTVKAVDNAIQRVRRKLKMKS